MFVFITQSIVFNRLSKNVQIPNKLERYAIFGADVTLFENITVVLKGSIEIDTEVESFLFFFENKFVHIHLFENE